MIPFTITVPAAGASSGVATVLASGKYFLCTAINGSVTLLTNTQDEYDFAETGFGFGNDASPSFGKLTFYNAGGTAVTITFYVSNSPIKISDVTVQSSVTVNSQLTNTLAGCALAGLTDLLATAAVANTANKFIAGSTPFRKCTILAYQAFGAAGSVPTANAGQVMIGVSATRQPIVLNPGDVWTFEAPTGAKYDLSTFYISAPNAGDGILIIYS
jgi:hypothetical protein